MNATETAMTDLLMRYGVREYDFTESTDGTIDVALADGENATISPTGEGDGWDFTVRLADGALDREAWVTDGDWLAREVAQLVRGTSRY